VFDRLTQASIRSPRTVVLAFVALFVVSGVGVTRLVKEDDLLVFLPTDDPDVALFSDVGRRFGALRVALIGVEAAPASDVFAPEFLVHLRAASDALRNVRGVDRLVSLTTLSDVTAGPMGAEVTPLVPGPPVSPEERAALRKKVLSRDHVVGSFVSANGRAALILAFLADTGVASASGPGAAASPAVGDEGRVEDRLRATANEKLAGFTTYFGGAPFAGRAIYEEAQADVRRLSPLALLILLLVVILAFRDLVGVALTVVSVGLATLIVLGGMGYWGEHFTVATSTLPVILFASGSSYAVHVVGRYHLIRKARPDGAPADAISEALRVVGPPLLIAAGTTAVGFYSFIATDVRPMRAFGIACGSGVILCWLIAVTLVPAVVALMPRRSGGHLKLERIGDGLVALWRWSARRRRRVLAIAILLAAILCGPALGVRVRMEPRTFFRVGSEPWRAEKFLDEQFGGATFIDVALTGDFDDPATLREVARLEDYTRSLENVTEVSSLLGPLRLVSDAMGARSRLPSTSAQAANLYFFLEGEAGARSLIAEGRKAAVLHVRVRGDASSALNALERFAAAELRPLPGSPTRADLAERIHQTAIALDRKRGGARPPDRTRIARALKVLDAPGDLDEGWAVRRAEVVRDFFRSELAPVQRSGTEALTQRAAEHGAPGWQDAVLASAKSLDDGKDAIAVLETQIVEARRALAVDRALPLILDAAGLDLDDEVARRRVAPILEDVFTPPTPERATTALKMQVAGEPILDRGFSRAVERNQIRSLAISVVVVLLLLLALFRSLTTALICMVPSLLTMVTLFGGMGLLHVSIDLGTSLVAGIATGAGSDFAMHYLWYLRGQPADEVSRSVGPVMVISIVLVSLGFAVLALGQSPVMHLFGALAGLSMSLSALYTCLLVPALLTTVGASPTASRTAPSN
jgi:predicted RND superfamily exporter protein